MMLSYLMVIVYIACCIRVATKPCCYFQLNSPFFDERKGVFSKLKLDEFIPLAWRLAQRYDDGVSMPDRYPLFVKPEWSQNAAGVYRADNHEELQQIRQKTRHSRANYLLQEGAIEGNEYEIFSIPHHRSAHRYVVLTVTQACNQSETNPVNSIHNENTRYVEITEQFSAAQLEQLWEMVRCIGVFKISRVSVRADSLSALLRGDFHVIEINLFLPMPIHLLDKRYTVTAKYHLVWNYMMYLALLTKYRDKELPTKPVFIKSMLYNRHGKLLNFLRNQL